jgi:cell fate regulator YaaT (PSP1 superfamily)
MEETLNNSDEIQEINQEITQDTNQEASQDSNQDSNQEQTQYISSPQNNFISRGCCREPKPYQSNLNLLRNGCAKLDTYNWLKDFPENQEEGIVEVRFKNSRKDFFKTSGDTTYEVGDIVAVEASPGHDIGIISLTGELGKRQMIKKGIHLDSEDIKKVYRKARLTDIEKWVTAVENESPAMFKTRKISRQLKLNMKINDVEYQGDNTKAIFYYTAEERVDFRELIKVLADEFRVRIEMRQIGVRQEAARLGGIGTCGRELCCSNWLSDFHTVTTGAARVQQLSLNPQKLAGQCGKLKCCLNYEYDTYLDALKDFPNNEIVLRFKNGDATHQKTDIFKKTMWYSYTNDQSNLMALPVHSVQEIIEKNAKRIFPEKLDDFAFTQERKADFDHLNAQDDLTRFD